MRFGIFSDIHSNLEALTSVFLKYRDLDIDSYVCLGDIVGYGADPVACISFIREKASIVVAGNHDWAAAGRSSTQNFNPDARTAVIQNAACISSEDKSYLAGLKLVHEDKIFTLVHSTLQNPEGFYYLKDELSAIWTFRLMETSICFLAHTHKPQILELEDECRVNVIDGNYLRLKGKNKYIINAGSVGQPRDSDPRASFCIFDTVSGEVFIERAAYDIDTASKKIVNAGLPKFMAERLKKGE